MNLASRIAWVLSLIGAVVVGVAGTSLFGLKPPPPQVPQISLEKMGHLVSVKVNYADVVEFTETRTLDILWSQWGLPIGGTKVLLVARGDCNVATDLRVSKQESVDVEARTLTLKLEQPKPLSPRVRHDARDKGGSFFYAISNQGLEPIIPDSENRTRAVNSALALAQKDVERVCGSADVRATARKSAEDVIAAIYQAVGWSVKFSWVP